MNSNWWFFMIDPSYVPSILSFQFKIIVYSENISFEANFLEHLAENNDFLGQLVRIDFIIH